MTESPEDRSSMAQAMVWSARITTIAMEMAVPAAVGYWLDEKLGTKAVFLILGVILGMVSGMWHLTRIGAESGSRASDVGQRPNGDSER